MGPVRRSATAGSCAACRLEADLKIDAAQRRSRDEALVGYTNAGKSTLLNVDRCRRTANRLFVTLDPTRQFALPGER